MVKDSVNQFQFIFTILDIKKNKIFIYMYIMYTVKLFMIYVFNLGPYLKFHMNSLFNYF